MKRLIPAVLILVLLAALTVYSTLRINRTVAELTALLERAADEAVAGNYSGARETLGVFHETMESNNRFLLLFVRRDLIYNVESQAASLRAYAEEDNISDFLADISKTIRQLHIIHHTTLNPA